MNISPRANVRADYRKDFCRSEICLGGLFLARKVIFGFYSVLKETVNCTPSGTYCLESKNCRLVVVSHFFGTTEHTKISLSELAVQALQSFSVNFRRK